MMKLKKQISVITSVLFISGCATITDSKLIKIQAKLDETRIQKSKLEAEVTKSNKTIQQLTKLNHQLQSATASPASSRQLESTNAEYVSTANDSLSPETLLLPPSKITSKECYVRILMPSTPSDPEQQEDLQGAISFLHWHAVLCSINTTPIIVRKLQQALLAAGYNPGIIDGVIGASTVRAIASYQKENNLAEGQITLHTLKSLGVDY